MAQAVKNQNNYLLQTPHTRYEEIGVVWSAILNNLAMPQAQIAREKMGECIDALKKAKNPNEIFDAIKPVSEMIRIIGEKNELGYKNTNYTHSIETAIRQKEMNCASACAMLGSIIDEMMKEAGKKNYDIDIAIVGSIDKGLGYWSGTNKDLHTIVRLKVGNEIRCYDPRMVDEGSFEITQKEDKTAIMKKDGLELAYFTYRIVDYTSLDGLEVYLKLKEKKEKGLTLDYEDAKKIPIELVRPLGLNENELGYLGIYGGRLNEIENPATKIQVVLSAIPLTKDEIKSRFLCEYFSEMLEKKEYRNAISELDLTKFFGVLEIAYKNVEGQKSKDLIGKVIAFGINHRGIASSVDLTTIQEAAIIVSNLKETPETIYALFRCREFIRRIDFRNFEKNPVFEKIDKKIENYLSKKYGIEIDKMDQIKPEGKNIWTMEIERTGYKDIILRNLFFAKKDELKEDAILLYKTMILPKSDDRTKQINNIKKRLELG